MKTVRELPDGRTEVETIILGCNVTVVFAREDDPGNHENRHRPDHERLCRAPGAGNTGIKQNREQTFSKKAAPGLLLLRMDKTSISCH